MPKKKLFVQDSLIVTDNVTLDNFELNYLKLVTWNVMSYKYNKTNIVDNDRYSNQIKLLVESNADLILLQEVDEDFYDLIMKSELGSSMYNVYSTGCSPYGQVTLSKKSMNYIVYSFGKKSQKKLLFTFTATFIIVNCHLSARYSEKAQRASQVKHIVDELSTNFGNHCKIITGDFNFCDENETVEGWNDIGKIDNIVRNTFFKKNKYNDAYGITDDYRFDRLYTDFPINRLQYKITDYELSDHAFIEMILSKL